VTELAQAEQPDHMLQKPDTVRLIRIFVSSPGDVAEEREVLSEAIQRINETQGKTHGVRLELVRWERTVVPQIGPRPQAVVDAQTQAYDVYLGIMSSRFGTPTDTHGSGTEQELREAVARWGKVGRLATSELLSRRVDTSHLCRVHLNAECK
jgi:hypothetical protein